MSATLARALRERPDVSLRCALAVWQRNASVYRKTFHYNIVPNFFEPVLYLLAMGWGVGSYVSSMGERSYVEFLAPGLLASQAMMGASFEVTYNCFVKMHLAKTYQAITATPVSPADVALGELLWAITRGTGYGLTFLLVVALFGAVTTPASLLVVIAVPFVAALFASLGLAFTALVELIEVLNYYYALFLTPLFLFSGIFFPLERLPDWARGLAWWTPLFHGVRACRGLFEGRVDASVLASLGWMAVVTVAFTWVSMGIYSWRLRR